MNELGIFTILNGLNGVGLGTLIRLSWWKASDGVNEDALYRVFGNYLY